jgi:Fe-S cluster assembly iron-binding protein IscA
MVIMVIFISYKSKSKRRGLQRTAENNNDVIRLHITPTNCYNSRYNNRSVSYPTNNNNNAQSNTRSTFVVADNSAYNYDINKICKLILMHCNITDIILFNYITHSR